MPPHAHRYERIYYNVSAMPRCRDEKLLGALSTLFHFFSIGLESGQ